MNKPLPKYRFFLLFPNLGEREVFPKFNSTKISFSYEKWSELTEDFKITSSTKFNFVDSPTEKDTDYEIHKPYTLLKSYTDAFIQNIGITLKEYNEGLYVNKVIGRLELLGNDLDTFTDSQRKFTAKIIVDSPHHKLQNVIDNEYNILETDPTYKHTATLVSEAIDYNFCYDVDAVIRHLFEKNNLPITLSSDPFPFITNTLGIENFLISDKTDIKRPTATANSEKLELSLMNIFKWLNDLFALKYKISDTNILSFVHESENIRTTKNLSNDKILNINTRSFGFDNYSKSILFSYSESNTSGFVNQFIEFDVTEGEKTEKSLTALNCDLQFIIDNSNRILANPDNTDEVADMGAVFLACDSSFNIYEIGGIKNSKLQLDYLIEQCYYNYLFFNIFTQNGIDGNVNSIRKRKKTSISVFEDAAFNPNNLIKTSFGICEVTKRDISGNKMKIELIY